MKRTTKIRPLLLHSRRYLLSAAPGIARNPRNVRRRHAGQRIRRHGRLERAALRRVVSTRGRRSTHQPDGRHGARPGRGARRIRFIITACLPRFKCCTTTRRATILGAIGDGDATPAPFQFPVRWPLDPTAICTSPICKSASIFQFDISTSAASSTCPTKRSPWATPLAASISSADGDLVVGDLFFQGLNRYDATTT